MSSKILIPIWGNDVAPRFDLATEVLIATPDETGTPHVAEASQKFVILPQASSEKLCLLILTEKIGTVICGAIEEEHFQFLTWKKVKLIDSVIGTWQSALDRYGRGDLAAGDIL